MTDLTTKALRLREIEGQVIEILRKLLEKPKGAIACDKETESLTSTLDSLLEEYHTAVKEIRVILMEEHVPVIDNPDAREIVQKMTLGTPLPLERIFEADPDLKQLVRGALDFEEDWEEIEELAIGHFYSWFSGTDYVTALYETGVLVVGFRDIPPYLREYVAEARRSLVFQQYLAVCILCRAMLDISVNGIYHTDLIRRGLDSRTPRSETASTKVLKRIKEIVRDEGLSKRLSALYRELSKVVHPPFLTEIITHEKAETFFKDTLSVVNQLYSEYG